VIVAPAEPTESIAGPERRRGRQLRAALRPLAGLAVIVLALLALLALTRPAAAAPHKILVLPADGNADAATRAKLTAQVVKLAKSLDGQVATAEATFADTALAVGCAPDAAGCSDQVLATLGVDELIWATATKDGGGGGQARVVVRRATKGAAAREVSTTMAAGDPAERIDAGMAPLFAPTAATSDSPTKPDALPAHPGTAAGTAEGVTAQPLPPMSPEERTDRNTGIAFAVGGGVAVVLGLALWASYSSLQDSIDTHTLNTRADFDALKSLEDRAGTYAIAGDFLVLAGLTAGGVGAYFLYRYHQHSITVAPAPMASGAGLTLTILGGL
jgi:hypothetical protein